LKCRVTQKRFWDGTGLRLASQLMMIMAISVETEGFEGKHAS
jgi:hypothetical protein